MPGPGDDVLQQEVELYDRILSFGMTTAADPKAREAAFRKVQQQVQLYRKAVEAAASSVPIVTGKLKQVGQATKNLMAEG